MIYTSDIQNNHQTMNKPSIPKGTRDFSPAEMAKRNYIFDTIKQAMGIAGVATQCYSWKAKGGMHSSGAQIDMVLDRSDNIINICEIKFSKGEYTITKDYAMSLNNKVKRFIDDTKTKKSILLTMITTNGVTHNEYWNQIQKEITVDELF